MEVCRGIMIGCNGNTGEENDKHPISNESNQHLVSLWQEGQVELTMNFGKDEQQDVELGDLSRRQTHTWPYDFAETCVFGTYGFGKQLPRPGHCNPLFEEAPLEVTGIFCRVP
ncbi:hypothetical protein Goshw_022806 [Gossypium schwendimanii]|uniref:Uncharacterized protein n=1 Tax=Gossypium schwendimanii TaxID=34291 RepID=A0A7J9LZC7_GOSSC|nr:hypothetical protein [Gossypium schwendimanii]